MEREYLVFSLLSVVEGYRPLNITLMLSIRRGMDYVKNVVNPIRQVVPRRTIRGLTEDYGHLTADVVLLAGEVHYERKPVSCHEVRLSLLFIAH